MSWFRSLRSKLASSTDETVSRRRLFAGAGLAAGGMLLTPEAAAAREIEPGTVVDAQGNPVGRAPMVSDPFIGTIVMFAGNFAPRGWALCDGQLLAVSQNNTLFSILGTIYGGDGRTTFGLPDLRSRVPMHAGNGPGLSSRPLGQKGGAETTTLSTVNLPQHAHIAPQVQVRGTGTQAVGMTTGGAVGTATTSSEGSQQSFSQIQPYQVVNFIIALQGLFPSRN